MTKESPAEKQKIKEQNQRINRKSTILSLFAIILIIALSIPIILNSPTPQSRFADSEKEDKVPTLELNLYKLVSEKEILPIKTPSLPGDSIAFRISTLRPVHVGVGLSINGGKPELLFKGAKVPPGPDRLVERHDVIYSYTVQTTDKNLHFCIIHSDDHDHLQLKARNLAHDWPSLDQAACKQLLISDAK